MKRRFFPEEIRRQAGILSGQDGESRNPVKGSLAFAAILAALLLSTGGGAAFCSDLAIGSDLFPVKDLQTTRDANFTRNLQDILDSYRYTQNYSAGQFDCMDTCFIATSILQEYGYNSSTMARFALKGQEGESHLWLSVSDGLGRFAFIETGVFASGRQGLGEVVRAEDSANYSFGYALIDPMKVMQCFGYSEERLQSNRAQVEMTGAGPVALRQEDRDRERKTWIYQ